MIIFPFHFHAYCTFGRLGMVGTLNTTLSPLQKVVGPPAVKTGVGKLITLTDMVFELALTQVVTDEVTTT